MDTKYYTLFLSNFKDINILDDKIIAIKNMPIVFIKKIQLKIFNQKLIYTIKKFDDFKQILSEYEYQSNSFRKLIFIESEKIDQIFKQILSKDLIQINKINKLNKITKENNYEILNQVHIKIIDIRKRFIVLYNMFFGFENYILDVDLSKYKLITKNDLQFADIVLSIKSDNIINKTFYSRLIYYITHSHIQHASIYYGKEKNKYLFLDVIERYKKLDELKFLKLEKKYNKDNMGLVLRYKNNLSSSEKREIYKYLNSVIGIKYGLSKVLFLSFLYELFYKLPFYKRLKHPFSNRTLYCSENVVKAYECAGIFLSNKYDVSTVTPIDLLNNAQLEIVGYLKK